MAKYRLLERAFIGGELMEAGREIDFDGVPGRHMRPLDKAALAAFMAPRATPDPNLAMTSFDGFPLVAQTEPPVEPLLPEEEPPEEPPPEEPPPERPATRPTGRGAPR